MLRKFHNFCSVNNNRQWIQVDLLSNEEIYGVITQGRSDLPYWVTEYEVYYSTDGRSYQPVTSSLADKTPQTFNGNMDNHNPVTNVFNQKVVARFIRWELQAQTAKSYLTVGEYCLLKVKLIFLFQYKCTHTETARTWKNIVEFIINIHFCLSVMQIFRTVFLS